MKLKPLGDKIIVEVLGVQEQTESGLYLPETAQEKPHEAKVVAVGPGKLLKDGNVVSADVKKGDLVIFGKYAGSEVKVEDKEYLILSQDDILAVVS